MLFLINKRKKHPKIFFGWWMTLVSAIITGLGQGVTSYGSSALFKPIASELGFTRAATSVAASIRRLEFGIMAPVTGLLVDRFGPRWVIIFGICLMGTGLVSMRFISSIWAYYLVWGVIIGIGGTFALTIAVDKALTNWFVRKRGIAVSMRFVTISIVGVIVLPIITWLIATQGWRITCLIWAGVMFASLPLMWFFMKQKRPEYYGLLPDGAKVESQAEADTEDLIDKGVEYAANFQEAEFTLKQAMRTPAFWMLVITNTSGMIIHGGFNLHCIPFLTDMGIAPTLAGGMMAIMVFFTIPSMFLSGFIADRIRKERLRLLMAGAYLFQALGITIFLLNQTTASIFIFLIMYGFGNGSIRPLLIIIRGRFFGRKAYGSIEGASVMLEAPVALLAPVYTGWVYDTTGSYITAFILFAVLAVFATSLICLIKPPPTPVRDSDVNTIV